MGSPSLLCLQGVFISKPSCSEDGSHKFLNGKDPEWLLLPELWNSEGPQQAQTQPLCRNVGLTGSLNWDFFLWHVHSNPRKLFFHVGVILINLSYKRQQIFAAQFCHSNWMLQRHTRNTQFCEQPTFNYERNNTVEFLCFFVARLQTFSAGAYEGNQRRTQQWYKRMELARDSLFLLV